MDSSRNYFDDDVTGKLKLNDFEYEIPESLIAQYPPKNRGDSRMMVLKRDGFQVSHHKFQELPEFLSPGDCLVVNDTRVFPARLIGTKDKTGAKVEVFLLRNLENGIWEVMVKPARKVRLGNKIVFSDRFSCDIIDNTVSGGRIIEVHCDGDFFEILEEVGHTPLLPYIKRESEDRDREDYQTIFASRRGAVAAPTAGMHFTTGLMESIEAKGISVVSSTLHVGLGTFRPVQVDDISRHQMHSEFYELTEENAAKINKVRENGGKIVAVGTTAVRVLETVADRNGCVRQGKGWTDKYIFPPYQFRAVDRMITNFHLPQSTLLMLVSAFANHEFVLHAYQKAIAEKYRFYSYGDCMLIL